MIYLDNAATTKIAPEVLQAMLPFMKDEFGNAGSTYQLGRKAKDAIEHARAQVADLINCPPENIVFTSGGSESNNMVFKGIKDHLIATNKRHIIISAIEHESLLKAAASLIKEGFHITYILPDSNGVINVESLIDRISESTGLISVMHANNETGVINNIQKISEFCLSRDILFHSDCVQSAGFLDIDTDSMRGLSFASLSAHKIHGVKGVGALYIRDKSLLMPLIGGGDDQEFGLRGGTENTPGIVGFGYAADIAKKSLRKTQAVITLLKKAFLGQLVNHFESLESGGIIINGSDPMSASKVLNMRIEGIAGDTLMLMLDGYGIYISVGSACHSNRLNPSHVLTAMGLSNAEAGESIRVSFSKYNTVNNVIKAANTMISCITTLRNIKDEGN